ncbi:MAG: alpha/beta hydrolase [Dehalococcoidia bacterium]
MVKKLILISSGLIDQKYASSSFDLLPDEGDEVQLNMDIYRTVWDEASRLRGSGHLLEIVQRITCPIVAIHGDYDPHPANGIKHPLSQAIKDFRFVLLKKCGHYPWRERNARDTFYRILNAEIRQQ